jgi:hypothetical protein
MPFNPFREALGEAGFRAFEHESTFKPEADAALARFQAIRGDLERQVRRGDMTVKVAREKAEAAAAQLKTSLKSSADGYSATPRVFLERLLQASDTRKRSREHMSLEGLQRETNRLLRLALVEQQLQNRAAEFEGKTHVRKLPGGQPVATLDSLLSFHSTAQNAGDEAATEWARRQLEAMRSRITDAADLRRIERACDRPEVVNPQIVATYMEALQGSEFGEMERFVAHALEGRDANACVAAFLMARGEPGGMGKRWVRDVLNGLGAFPDAALATLRTLEADARGAESEAARAQADYAGAVAEAEARLTGIETPSEDEVARAQRVRSRPVAKLGEPIGLALDRRGEYFDELDLDAASGGPAG